MKEHNSYYQSQFKRLKTNDVIRVQFTDTEGNKTNRLDLTSEQYYKIKDILIKK